MVCAGPLAWVEDVTWGAILALLGRLLRPIIAPIAAYLKGRSDARREAERRALKDEQQRLEKGRQRVADGRDDDPADRLRRNDGHWD